MVKSVTWQEVLGVAVLCAILVALHAMELL